MEKLFELDDGFDNRYTRKIPHIQYVPKERNCPSVFSLYNTEKCDSLVEEINSKEIPEDVKKFLQLSATRHIVFNYERIAEYYCHTTKEVQELMEKSGLVIIDFDDALENGYVKLTKDLVELYENSEK